MVLTVTSRSPVTGLLPSSLPFTRECLALVADTSLPGPRVAREQVEWHYIAPGKPQQNAFIESFNGRLRDELLNETLFSSLAHAREVLSLWKNDYNTVRPHSGLGNLTPAAYADRSAPDKQRDRTLRYTGGSAPRPVASPSQLGSNQPGTLLIAG
jgi:putative transposase